MNRSIQIKSDRLTVKLSLQSREGTTCVISIYAHNAVNIRNNLERLNMAFDRMDFDSFLEQFVEFCECQGAAIDSEKSLVVSSNSELFSLMEDDEVYIGTVEFPKSRILELGSIEKDLIIFDMRYSGRLTAMSFIYSDALALVRKSLQWEDQWNFK